MDLRRKGRALANSLVSAAAPISTFPTAIISRRTSLMTSGTHIGEPLTPRPTYHGAAVFGVSRRRSSGDGSLAGVIQASVRPEYSRISMPDRPRSRQLLRARLTDGMGAARFPPPIASFASTATARSAKRWRPTRRPG